MIACVKEGIHTEELRKYVFSMVPLVSPLEKEAAMKDKVYELLLSFLTYISYKIKRRYLLHDYKENGRVIGGK